MIILTAVSEEIEQWRERLIRRRRRLKMTGRTGDDGEVLQEKGKNVIEDC